MSRNENACGNVAQSGTTRQFSCQQKSHDASLIESAHVTAVELRSRIQKPQHQDHLLTGTISLK